MPNSSDTIRNSTHVADLRSRLAKQEDAHQELDKTRDQLSEAQKVLRGARAQVRALEGLPHDGAVYKEALEDVRFAEKEVKRLKECEEEDKNTLRLRVHASARAARDLLIAIDADLI